MAVRLTSRGLASLRPPDGAVQADFPDGAHGLIVRVFASGRRTWLVRYRAPSGARRNFKIGDAAAISLAEARERAREIAAEVARGEDPAAARKTARTLLAAASSRPATLNDLWARYAEAARAGAHKARGRPRRESSLAMEQWRYGKHVAPIFGRRPFAEITRSEVRAFVDGLSAKGLGPSSVNHAGAIVRALLNFAVFKEWLQANPALGVATPFQAPSRDRVLTRAELSAICRGLADATAPMERGTAVALMVAAVTLQRLGEVTGMRVDELDLDARVWAIPSARMKNKRAHVVPLSPLALHLIAEARELPGVGACVFASRTDPDAPMDRHAASRAFRRLVQRLDIHNATPHDLRRTGATMLTGEAFGVPRLIVSKVLGHVSDDGGGGAVTAVYDRNAYLGEKRRALEAWASSCHFHEAD